MLFHTGRGAHHSPLNAGTGLFVTLPLAALLIAGCSTAGTNTTTSTSDPSAASQPSSDTDSGAGTGGGTDQGTKDSGKATTAPGSQLKTLPPKRIGQATSVGEVEFQVADVKRVTIKPGLPGDVEGPGARVDLVVTNSSGEQVPLTGVAVNLTILPDTPASPSNDSNNKSLPAEVAAGQSATGSFAFNLPDGKPFRAKVEVLYADGSTVAVFRGPIS